MATPHKELEKKIQIDHLRTNVYIGENTVKIGPVDPEIISLQAIIYKKKKKESKIYSPSGKFANRPKLEMPSKA